MTQRRWTFLIVPHGPDSTRGFSISERTVRRLASAAAISGMAVVVGVGVVVAQLVPRSGSFALDASGMPGAKLAALQARLDSMADTLAVISRRDGKIRLLAGLPSADDGQESAATAPSARSGDPVGVVAISTAGPARIGEADRTEADVDHLISRANTLAHSFAEVSDTLANNLERISRMPSIMPTAGWLSSNFSRSRFHPILHMARPHEGIDVAAPMGAPIVAPAAGTVRRVTRETGYGLILEIDHGYGIVTKFAHCSRVLVVQGQHLRRGQEVAAVGNSGLSTGPHLHYEIHVNGKVVDPLTYVMPSGAIPD